MEKNKLIERNNKEALGKYFLKKAVDFAFDKAFGKSYEYLKEGLDILTCDCNRGGWRNRFKNSEKTLFTDLLINFPQHTEYYFVKAYILSFEDEKKELYLGLDAIEKYLTEREDEYGLYVKGKILLSLEEHSQAFDAFVQASHFGTNSRILYRIGRTKEQHLSEYGLEDLYISFDANTSSSCCARILKKYMKEREIDLSLDENESNELLISFTDSDDEWKFDNLYEKYLKQEYFNNELTMPVISKFVEVLRANSEIFQEEVDEFEDNEDYDHYDEHDYHDDHDYDRDTFDALTDGQLGDYDDFDGDIDDVMTWLGR